MLDSLCTSAVERALHAIDAEAGAKTRSSSINIHGHVVPGYMYGVWETGTRRKKKVLWCDTSTRAQCVREAGEGEA